MIRQLLPSEIVQQLGQVYVFSIAQSFLLVHLLKGEQVAGGGNTIFKAAHAGSLGQNILLHGGYARERFLAAFLIVVLAVGNKIAHHVLPPSSDTRKVGLPAVPAVEAVPPETTSSVYS